MVVVRRRGCGPPWGVLWLVLVVMAASMSAVESARATPGVGWSKASRNHNLASMRAEKVAVLAAAQLRAAAAALDDGSFVHAVALVAKARQTLPRWAYACAVGEEHERAGNISAAVRSYRAAISAAAHRRHLR